MPSASRSGIRRFTCSMRTSSRSRRGGRARICVEGIGLARGYFNQPKLTATKFVAVNHLSGARVYRTGDRGRWLADGQLEFLGRLDDQVKHSGFRIELGEIEAALAEHPRVRQCSVNLVEVIPGAFRLVAHWSPADKRGGPPDFRIFLSEKLPYYMVPAWYVRLQQLPMTPNGKVDRKALPRPQGNRPPSRAPYVEPRDSFEYELVKLWEDLLGVRPIGIDDTYFDLGGASLLAVSLLVKIEKQFGKSVSIAEFLTRPTVRRLAEFLRSKGASE